MYDSSIFQQFLFTWVEFCSHYINSTFELQKLRKTARSFVPSSLELAWLLHCCLSLEDHDAWNGDLVIRLSLVVDIQRHCFLATPLIPVCFPLIWRSPPCVGSPQPFEEHFQSFLVRIKCTGLYKLSLTCPSAKPCRANKKSKYEQPLLYCLSFFLHYLVVVSSLARPAPL